MRRRAAFALWAAAIATPIAALVIALAATPASPTLDQNWTLGQRQTWYEASQGSRLLPLAWLQALEQPDGGAGLFLDDGYIARFRYLPYTTSKGLHLPVGFAIDVTDESALS